MKEYIASVSGSTRTFSHANRQWPTHEVRSWLQQDLRLNFPPFEHLEAGQDPRLARYLVDHGVFNDLLQPQNVILLAPRGGGKSAFRVRLSYECRIRRRRKILTLLVRSPGPAWAHEGEALYRWLNWSVAAEMLFQFAYRPYEYKRLDASLRRALTDFVNAYFVNNDFFMERLAEELTLAPLIHYLDPAMQGLPAQPFANSLNEFVDLWRSVEPSQVSNRVPSEDWQRVTDTLIENLDYEFIYLLVDGIDDWPMREEDRLGLIQWVSERCSNKVYAKYFAPLDLKENALVSEKSLTNVAAYHIIKWDRISLQEVIRQRIAAASSGSFDAFLALGDENFPEGVEKLLANEVSPAIPRELLLLAQRVFKHHLQALGPNGRLVYEDVEGALYWYRDYKKTTS